MFDTITLHEDDMPELKVSAVHDTWLTSAAAAKAIEAVCELPRVAVTTAVASWVRVPAVAVKEAAVDPAGIVTEVGSVN